ncbi:MAG: signal peptidase II [Clostridia bacterium]|nr:signal peptidase II [Clostridia bacterium]
MKISKTKLLIAIIVIIDQIIKFIITNNTMDVALIPNFLSLVYVKNTGIAFSLINKNLITVIISNSIILGIIIRFMILQKNKIDKMTTLALIFIISGGASNLIDRIFRFGVVDYIKVELFNFPVFNLSDICIVIGFAIFIYTLIIQMKKAKEENLFKVK